MPELHRYRLFVSHAWQYSDDYERLVRLLDNADNFIYSNYSVPRDDKFTGMTTSQLKDEIRGQISPVECVLVLAGIYVSHSDWIQFEIDFATERRKPVVGIQPWGSERTPAAVTSAAKIVVGWNTASIVEAIRKYSL